MHQRNNELVNIVATLAGNALKSGDYKSIQNIGDAVANSIAALKEAKLIELPPPSDEAIEVFEEVEKKVRFLCINIATELGYRLDRDKDNWHIVYNVIAPHICSAIDDAIDAWSEYAPTQNKTLHSAA